MQKSAGTASQNETPERWGEDAVICPVTGRLIPQGERGFGGLAGVTLATLRARSGFEASLERAPAWQDLDGFLLRTARPEGVGLAARLSVPQHWAYEFRTLTQAAVSGQESRSRTGILRVLDRSTGGADLAISVSEDSMKDARMQRNRIGRSRVDVFSPQPVDKYVDVLRKYAQEGVIHGGIEPWMLGRNPNWAVVLWPGVPWLVAAMRESICPALGGSIGDPRYMAPEVMDGQMPTTASDLYSLGLAWLVLRGAQFWPDPHRERELLGPSAYERRIAILPSDWLTAAGESGHGISASDRSLLLSLLDPDPEARLTGAGLGASRLFLRASDHNGGSARQAQEIRAQVHAAPSPPPAVLATSPSPVAPLPPPGANVPETSGRAPPPPTPSTDATAANPGFMSPLEKAWRDARVRVGIGVVATAVVSAGLTYLATRPPELAPVRCGAATHLDAAHECVPDDDHGPDSDHTLPPVWVPSPNEGQTPPLDALGGGVPDAGPETPDRRTGGRATRTGLAR